MQYRVGDVIRLKTEKNYQGYTRVGWDDRMNDYMGIEVTIESLDDGSGYISNRNHRFRIKESPRWTFWVRDIAEMIRRADGLPIEIPVPREKTNYLKTPKEVGKIAREVYGDNRIIEFRNDVIVHFPEIEITNSNKKSHIIRDLYVKVHISTNVDDDYEDEDDLEGLHIVTIGLDGMRTTYTLPEADKNYNHSHLSCGGFCQWSTFCLGKSDFTILIANLSLDPVEEQWQMFFLALDKYVRWESIEGGPYARLEEIGNSRTIDQAVIKKELARIVRGIPLDSFDIIGDRLVLKDCKQVYDFFNKFSTIRNMSTMTEEQLETAMKQKLDNITKSYGKQATIGDKKVDWQIVKHSFESPDEDIDIRIVKSYINIFNSCNINLNTISYEREKRNQKTFGEVGVI